MSNPDYKSASGDRYRRESEYSRPTAEHHRRESELSGPVSDYEYFQYSTNRAPPTPQTPSTTSAPPRYAGARSPVSPPLESNPSNTGIAPVDAETYANYSNYPEVVTAGMVELGAQYRATADNRSEQQAAQRPNIPDYQLTPDHGEKEAYLAPKNNYQTRFEEHPTSPYRDVREDPVSISQGEEDKPRRYLFGLTKKKFIVAIVALVLLIIGIAVGVGVGVGLGTSHDDSPSNSTDKDSLYSMGGALNPAYYSTEGAFNGSGIALADVNFGIDNSLYIFYQKHTGEIEQLIYKADGSWTFVTQVATDAKNSTPLSTVAYIVDSVATWHLFYVSEDNILKQRTQSNASSFQTNIWEDGPLTRLELKVNDADSVGMQACYWGNFYGSLTDYNNASFGASNATASTGMNM